MYLRHAFLQLGLAILANGGPIAKRSGTTTEQITYVLPIWEGALASHGSAADLSVLSAMKSQLGVGGSYTKLGWSFSSWGMSRDTQSAANDYTFDPTNLNYMLSLAVSSGLPILVHLNDGRWADCCTPNSSGGWGDALLDHIAAQAGTTVLDSSGNSLYGHNGGSNYFTLSRLNTVYRNYKKRNVQATAAILTTWAAANPTLFAGVSLDSETLMAEIQADHNPMVVTEWKQWLQNTGIYGPGGEFFGAGRIPAFTDIASFNSATGQSFASWDAMQPPGSITPGDLLGEEWERWRVMLILHSVSDETQWIVSAGIDRNIVFGHQTPRIDDYAYADDLMTATAANGAGGVTQYAQGPDSLGHIDNPLRGSGKNNWGNFELNPMSSDATTSYNDILTLYNDGVKIICPNSWESDQTTKDQYAIFGSPNFGDTFGNALNKFLSSYGNTPRNLQPPATNPGTRVYDFYDNFSGASLVGQDNHLEAAGSVGNIVRKSIYSATAGTITYSVTIPNVPSGQRLNFWTSVGIKDGAGVGGETQFQVTINGSPLFGTFFHFNKNYWIWKRWVPIMVDVTAWAGQTVQFSLITTGNDIWGWTMWGSPAIYASTTANNLAWGQLVSVSSSDGIGAGWDQNYLTDGQIDGGVYGRAGWSSVAHSTSTGPEWAHVDLGAPKSIGKVVLFSRSDMGGFTGTGFPTNFIIQASLDASTWWTIITENNYPGPKAGEGQIFTFPQAITRYVRVYAFNLGGVGSESGYRMQLEEIEVYA